MDFDIEFQFMKTCASISKKSLNQTKEDNNFE